MQNFADVNPEDFDTRNQASLDEKLLVKFEMKSKPDNEASAREGRPVFKDVEYIDIRVPGQKDGACRPARPGDIARFPRHYEAFKRRISEPETGTPLKEWPRIARSMVETLSFFNVKTVEHLSEMNDGDAMNIPGAVKLRTEAKEYLEFATQAKESADAGKLKQENEELKASVAELQEQVKQLLEVSGTEKPKKKAAKKPAKKANPLSD